MATLQCIVVTPESTVRDVSAKFVALPLYDGEIGLAPGHSPMIGRLGFGEMRIVSDEGTERLYVDGGFVQVTDNTVSVLTDRAIAAANLDAQVATEQLAAARAKPAAGDQQMAFRERTEAQCRAQLRIARASQQ